MTEVVATNTKGNTIRINFSLNEAGQKIRVGSGSDGILYRGTMITPKGSIPIAIKEIIFSDERKTDKLMKIAKSSEACFFLFAKTPPKNIMRFHGTIINSENFQRTKDIIGVSTPPAASAEGGTSEVTILNPNNPSAYARDVIIFQSDQVEPNQSYILYELINGRNLYTLLEEGPVDYKNYGLQLLTGINFMHNLEIQLGTRKHIYPIAHMDMKPENIMIDDKNILKIIDLNTICIATDKSGTACKRDSGTLQYLSFENIKKGSNKINALLSQDVFATGITLYRMITGRHAIPLKNPIDQGEWVEFWKTMPGEFDLDFPPGTEQWKPLIQAMIVKEGSQRIPIAQALEIFKSILEAGGANLPAAAVPEATAPVPEAAAAVPEATAAGTKGGRRKTKNKKNKKHKKRSMRKKRK